MSLNKAILYNKEYQKNIMALKQLTVIVVIMVLVFFAEKIVYIKDV